MDVQEREEVWASEEPPKLLPWTFPHALLHSFFLVSSLGSSVRVHTPGGRATAVFFTLLGMMLYLGVVALWAARLGYTFSLVVRVCTKKKVCDHYFSMHCLHI